VEPDGGLACSPSSEVINAREVWVTEGEKDCDNLRKYGLIATTNAMGAGKWCEAYSETLKGKAVIICGDSDSPGIKHVSRLEKELNEVASSTRTVRIPEGFKDISELLESLPSDFERIEALERLRLEAPEKVDGVDLAELDRCAFDFDHQPKKPESVFKLCGQSIATAGNLVMVQGQIKVGKSAVLSAMIAGGICGDDGSVDLLGLECKSSEGKAIIHFDTEQSRYDYDALRIALRRAGGPTSRLSPELLVVMSRAQNRFPMLRACMARAHQRFGGIHFVLIDGICDLFPDVNDGPASIENVEKLQRLAITYNCPIICVIHENPGSEFGKTRGHLGSQLGRKAQSNLKIVKDSASEIITLFTDSSRHAHVSKADGVRFKWDHRLRMHSGLAADTELLRKREEARAEFKEEISEIFHGYETGMLFMELINRIREMRKIQYEGAKSRLQTFVKFGLIAKDEKGHWYPRL
jgi:5S rRNA maturation endonuclease (ribonuclease M5)